MTLPWPDRFKCVSACVSAWLAGKHIRHQSNTLATDITQSINISNIHNIHSLWIFLCDVSNIKDQSYQDFDSNLFNCQTNFLAFFNSSPFTYTSANVLNKSEGNFQQEIWDEHAADGNLTHIYGGQQENSNISIWEKYFLNTNFFSCCTLLWCVVKTSCWDISIPAI